MRDDSRGQRPMPVRAGPLHDIIVLHPLDEAAVEPAGAHERADIGDMDGCESGRELDRHLPAAGQIHDQQGVGRDGPPGRSRRGRHDLAG
jgi:hypothetical protein